VTTTIDSHLQQTANEALRRALREYDERHDYRGPESHLPPEALDEVAVKTDSPRAQLDAALDAMPSIVGLLPASWWISRRRPPQLKVLLRDTTWWSERREPRVGEAREQRAQARRHCSPHQGRQRVAAHAGAAGAGRVRRARSARRRDPRAGRRLRFFQGKYNRVVQAHRQPAAAQAVPVLRGTCLRFHAGIGILDAPVVFDDPALEDTWRPENYTGKFYGPTRLREALVQSRNLVSIRLLQAIGIPYARNFAAQFGLPIERMPATSRSRSAARRSRRSISRAATACSRMRLPRRAVLRRPDRRAGRQSRLRGQPAIACAECAEARALEATTGAGSPRRSPRRPRPRPTSRRPRSTCLPGAAHDGGRHSTGAARARAAPRHLMRDMMRDVVTSGTGARARELGRNDMPARPAHERRGRRLVQRLQPHMVAIT